MNILDFDWHFLLFLGFVSVLGVVANELFIYSNNEANWNWNKRKGDIFFSAFTAPVSTIFAMPYLWFYLDGVVFLGVELSVHWYNAGTSLLTGILIIQLFSFIKKKAAKKIKEI